MDTWEKLSEAVVHDGLVPILARRFRGPDGLERTTEIKVEGPTVAILAVTPERKVVLERQFRPGPDRLTDVGAGFRGLDALGLL